MSAMAEPIFRGIENYYFGFNLGFRYNFVPRAAGLFRTFPADRRRVDRQPREYSRRPGPGFHVQHFIGGGYFLHGE